MTPQALIDQTQFDDDGLVLAIAQDAETKDVLMVAYMNEEALRETLHGGTMTYWSRSRQQLWRKGESSGHTQHVNEVRIDCDGDALLFTVEQVGRAACHTGHRSCFYRRFDGEALVRDGTQVFDPDEVYG